MYTDQAQFDPLRCVQGVHEALGDLQHGVPPLAAITRIMGISERTLRRRLRAVGTSYNAILKDVRAQAAKNILLDQMITVDRVAAQLGYSETANFRHAFKRWTGHSPQAYRSAARSMLQDAGP